MSASPTVVLVGAFDTKAEPLGRLADLLRGHGCRVVRVDYGTDPAHRSDAEHGPDAVAEAAGTTVTAAREPGRQQALATMSEGVRRLLGRLRAADELDALVLAGGSGAATVFAACAPALPFGVPKVLVSTIVAGDTRPYLQGLDATLFYPVADVEGDNAVLRSVLARAAAATAAQARETAAPQDGADGADGADLPVGVTMFGITTPCVSAVRRRLERRGHEVVAFHANGTGGRSLERLVADRRLSGVVDVTTTELADLVAGGTLSAGSARLTAAADAGVPQVVVPGALDTVNFGPAATVPERFSGRILHAHNEHVTLMRTDVEESARLGRLLAERVNAAPDTSAVVLPLGGVSELDRPEGPFWWPEADEALREALRGALDPGVRLVTSPLHLNDDGFADLLVDELVTLGGAA